MRKIEKISIGSIIPVGIVLNEIKYHSILHLMNAQNYVVAHVHIVGMCQ